MITRRKICIKNIMQGSDPCHKPTIQFESLSDCVSLVCIEDNCIEIEVEEGCDNPCFRLVIDCEDCHQCPPQIKDICLCENSDDCPTCEECIDGLCVDLCPDQLCDPSTETCVDCITTENCECDQQCVNGECTCAPGKLIDSKGCCVDCIDNSNCPPCTICVGGVCVPLDCGTGVCDPANNSCVECLSSGDCTAANTCCVNNQCVCCPGYYYNPSTGECEEIPDCTSDTDCPTCYICVAGECQPLPCPDGFICIDNECRRECDCVNRDCPGQTVCFDHHSGDCYCGQCTGTCNTNFECAPGCSCIEGNCVKNTCTGTCNDGRDCGFGCGCFNGECYPCNSFDCLGNNLCDLIDGCQCFNDQCINSNCVGPCNDMNDCAPGCGCKNGMCVPCNTFDCDDCDIVHGCGCEDGVNCEDIKAFCNKNGIVLTRSWVPGSGGTVTSPGQSAYVPTQTVQSLGIESLPGGGYYKDHQFNLNTNGFTSGTFYYSPNKGQKQQIGSGTSISIKLSDFTPVNLFGFYIIWEESGPGQRREIIWKVYFNQSSSLQTAGVWNVEVKSSSGIPPVISGGTPGYFELCLNSSRFDLTTEVKNPGGSGVTVNYTKISKNCVRENAAGCGDFYGQLKAICKGQAFWFDIPVLEVDGTCCDGPVTPDCVGGDGEPCTDITSKTIDLEFFPTFEGTGVVMPAINSISFEQMYNWGPTLPWQVSGDGSINNYGTYVGVQFHLNFCVSLSGLQFGCSIYDGEVCVDLCNEDDLEVFILELGPTTFKGIPLTHPSVPISLWDWSITPIPSGSGAAFSGNSSNQTVYTNQEFGFQLDLEITIADGDCQEPQASTTLIREKRGCTNPSACNYDEEASINDGSCIMFSWEVGYNCEQGLQFSNTQIPAGHSVQFRTGIATILNNGDAMSAGNNAITARLINNSTNDIICSSSIVLQVPQCQECITGDGCVNVPNNKKLGSVPSDQCDPNSCVCSPDNCYEIPLVYGGVNQNGDLYPTGLIINGTTYAISTSNFSNVGSVVTAVENALQAAGAGCFEVTSAPVSFCGEVCNEFRITLCSDLVVQQVRLESFFPSSSQEDIVSIADLVQVLAESDSLGGLCEMRCSGGV